MPEFVASPVMSGLQHRRRLYRGLSRSQFSPPFTTTELTVLLNAFRFLLWFFFSEGPSSLRVSHPLLQSSTITKTLN
ncbi:hypothetical protein K1719_008584 [Acacia pycnantha]|nr:hypothetical protein K1719_008584 [Acacia pycnantha]